MTQTPMDIIFLSFRESNAEKNWENLKARFPRAKRVHGVSGILQAHLKAAEISTTHHFYLVDGDTVISEGFDFSWPLGHEPKENTIYVWRCLNPANNLAYGYGALKLYNKTILENRKKIKMGLVDLATTVAENYHIIHRVASETLFFGTPEEAWRGAFRECAKLAAQGQSTPLTPETNHRLNVWCSVINPVENSSWVLKGAKAGREYAQSGGSMEKINDFDWLRSEFHQRNSYSE